MTFFSCKGHLSPVPFPSMQVDCPLVLVPERVRSPEKTLS